MQKNVDSVETFTLNSVTHGRITRKNNEIVEIRIIKRVGMGNSFIKVRDRAELLDLIGLLQELEQTL